MNSTFCTKCISFSTPKRRCVRICVNEITNEANTHARFRRQILITHWGICGKTYFFYSAQCWQEVMLVYTITGITIIGGNRLKRNVNTSARLIILLSLCIYRCSASFMRCILERCEKKNRIGLKTIKILSERGRHSDGSLFFTETQNYTQFRFRRDCKYLTTVRKNNRNVNRISIHSISI